MILNRSNFENVIDAVKLEICCSIPGKSVSEIETDTFKDWVSLEYVYIPSSVKVVRKNAFIWENIKILFVDLTKTTIEDLPKNVRVMPIVGNEVALFEMLSEVAEIKKTLEFDPEVISNIDKKLKSLTEDFVADNKTLEENVLVSEEKIVSLVQKLEQYNIRAKEIGEGVLRELNDIIEEHLGKEVKLKREELNNCYTKIKEELVALEQILKKCNDTKTSLRDFDEQIRIGISKKREELEGKIEALAGNIEELYEQSRQDLIDRMVRDATEMLALKNPCKKNCYKYS